MKSPRFILVIGGGNGDCHTTMLRGNALQPVTQYLAACTCLFPRWPTSQQPQGSRLKAHGSRLKAQGSRLKVWVLLRQGCDSLIH